MLLKLLKHILLARSTKMPSAPRSKGKATQIAYNILGVPQNLQDYCRASGQVYKKAKQASMYAKNSEVIPGDNTPQESFGVFPGLRS